ncbi:MAG TPA: NAD(P)/FAD-dependent oxidoreductase [Solirubrobacteraceae bacterium]|nr:NAD(P)/FAD-dependent oxidoreductase [Solirubrobacteraceae bacterium]
MSAASYDAVVVGAGQNGLTAAVTLARAGRSVLCVEAAETVGGAAATAELTLPGFRHDVFSAVHPAGIASPVFAELDLERHGLHWVQPELAMVHPLPAGRGAALARDLAYTVASLDALGAGAGRRWRQFVEPYVRHFEAVRATMLAGFPPVAGPARLLPAFGLQGSLEFARLLLLSADALAAEALPGEGAAWLYGSSLHGDAPLDGAGSAIAGVWLNVLGHTVGWPSPRGGAGSLTGALASCLRALGGETRTGAPAARVLAHRRRVAGVELAGGERIAARTVVATTTPHGLVALAGDALGDAYTRRALRFRYGPHTVKVDWALDAPIPWEHDDARRAGTVHVGGTAAQLRSALRDVAAGRLPDAPFLLCGQQSLADPTRAPAGKHTAWSYTHTPTGIDWTREREPFADTIERQVESFAPGFRERVLARHVMAPGDLEARNACLPGGDVGHGSYALDQLVFRPVPALNPYSTPVRGLFIGGASTFPGGAVHGVNGHAAARAALRESWLPRPPHVRLRRAR